MIRLLPSILSFLEIVEFVLGYFSNSFIALVNCTDWVKRQNLSCTDQILTALAVSRIILLWVTIFNWYATVLDPAFCNSELRVIVHIAWVVSNHFSLWLATSLSIFHLLKIANFSCFSFLHLKRKAKRVVVMMLWWSLAFLICRLALVSTDEKMKMNEYEGNATWVTNLRNIVHLAHVTVFTFVYFIPFTMSLTAFLLLIFSLWKHLKKMQISGKGSQDPSSKVHVRAMQTVISFLFLFVIHVLVQMISLSSITLPNNSVLMLFQVLGILYPSGHSLILIWGNKKQKLDSLSFLWQLRCWMKKRK
ncbi:LOW QUALITY PROTEIN: taste receptor type 2 member 31-like [Molossus nigricans]